jgi:glycine cleavage system H lipoate-binding protein
MNRLIRNGWSLSQLIEEWNYHRDERLGILCEGAESEPWMVKLAEDDANEAVKRLVQSPSSEKSIPLGGCPNDDR